MITPLWKWIPSGLAHQLAPVGISFYSEFLKQCGNDKLYTWKPLTWNHLQFRNPLGIAGGVDKNGDLLNCWPELGTGFVEIGTVTPCPQESNPGKITDRDWEHRNLWNKMGFPSAGAKDVFFNLKNSEISQPLFVNIGKNRNTANSQALQDYIDCVKILKSEADAFVINVSSPNTKGLRDLQNAEDLKTLVSGVQKEASPLPVLLKLSPDLNHAQLEEALLSALEANAQGFILTNTTLSRPTGCPFPHEGGLSGADLKSKSIEILKKSLAILGSKKKNILMVSVGGIFSADDIQERLDLGADLVQVYSALVFEGPSFFKNMAIEFSNRKGNL